MFIPRPVLESSHKTGKIFSRKKWYRFNTSSFFCVFYFGCELLFQALKLSHKLHSFHSYLIVLRVYREKNRKLHMQSVSINWPKVQILYLAADNQVCFRNTRSQNILTLTSRNMYSWIVHQLDIGTSFERRHNQVGFQFLGHFLIPKPKLHWEKYLIVFP